MTFLALYRTLFIAQSSVLTIGLYLDYSCLVANFVSCSINCVLSYCQSVLGYFASDKEIKRTARSDIESLAGRIRYAVRAPFHSTSE